MSSFVDCVLQGKIFVRRTGGGKAQAIAELPSGEHVVMFEGQAADAKRYPEYVARCAWWMREDGEGPVPTFRREQGQYEIVSCPMDFDGRVTFAATRIREQDTDHRAYEACFEFFDGDKVVYAIMQKSKRDPFLRRGIEAMGSSLAKSWADTQRQGGGMPLLALLAS